jgi:hypothetical protein
VRLGRRGQPVERVRRDLDGGVEPEGEVGGGDVVVDRLGHPDDGHAFLGQAQCRSQRAVAADDDHRVDAARLERGADAHVAVGVDVRVSSRGAEDRAAALQDAADRVAVERPHRALEQAVPAVEDPDDLVPVSLRPRHHRADHRVQAGAVAARGQDADRRHQ